MYCIELAISKGFVSNSSHLHRHRKVEAEGAGGGGPVVVSLRIVSHWLQAFIKCKRTASCSHETCTCL